MRGSLGRECAESLLVAVAELGINLLAPGTVFIALEYRRYGNAKVCNQPGHVASQGAAAARRQFNGKRFIRLTEIIDIYPVAGPGLAGCARTQIFTHHGVLAAARRAHHKQVVTVAPDTSAEFKRYLCPALSDEACLINQFRRGTEVERARWTAPAQKFRGQWLHVGYWHRKCPLETRSVARRIPA